MNGYDTYKEQRALGWSRVDLLVAIYSATIRNIEQSLIDAEQGDEESAQAKRFHAMRLVFHLQTGLDYEHGELPQQIGRLCEFVQHSLISGDSDKLRGAIKVLEELRDGFEGIREEAVKMEANGEVDGLSATPGSGRSATA